MATISSNKTVILTEDPALVKAVKTAQPRFAVPSTVITGTPPTTPAVLPDSISELASLSPTEIAATTTYNTDKTLYLTNVNQNTNNQFYDVTTNVMTGGGVYSVNTLTGALSIMGSTGTTVTAAGSNIVINNVYEAVSNINGANGVVVHNFSTSSIFNHTNITVNFTANIINLNLASGYATNVVLILNQGMDAYIPSAVQINGIAKTISWQGGAAPLGNSNKKDLVSFSITNIGGAYTVFGQLVTFG